MNTNRTGGHILVLGIGNLLMGDEGLGVHAIRALEKETLPDGVVSLDGGTGSFLLLEPMQEAKRVILIDAAALDAPIGTVRRLRPRFSSDYPRTLTAHDIGLKDLIDTFYLLGEQPDITLYAVAIDPEQQVGIGLSDEIAAAIPEVVAAILQEVRTGLSSAHLT